LGGQKAKKEMKKEKEKKNPSGSQGPLIINAGNVSEKKGKKKTLQGEKVTS